MLPGARGQTRFHAQDAHISWASSDGRATKAFDQFRVLGADTWHTPSPRQARAGTRSSVALDNTRASDKAWHEDSRHLGLVSFPIVAVLDRTHVVVACGAVYEEYEESRPIIEIALITIDYFRT